GGLVGRVWCGLSEEWERGVGRSQSQALVHLSRQHRRRLSRCHLQPRGLGTMAATRAHFTFRVSQRKPRTCRGFQQPNKGGSLEGHLRLSRRSDTIQTNKAGKARNQMQRSGLRLMVRPETSRVSLCPTQAPSTQEAGLFFKSRPRRIGERRTLSRRPERVHAQKMKPGSLNRSLRIEDS